jgi:hypothetical protein
MKEVLAYQAHHLPGQMHMHMTSGGQGFSSTILAQHFKTSIQSGRVE